ncbi:MAG: transglutaminase domain-containing protein, partial [Anaerolineae bacterium]|nr:transglutaminase domain-containing protein [Anaerolineae bacterium]
GLWFIRGNMVRDLAALNKIEILPWDWQGWTLIEADDKNFTDADWELLDRTAELTLADNSAFEAVHAIYADNAGLRMPDGWLDQN